MAGLQYRPIDAPDFGTAMRGFQIGQGLIGNAFSGLDSILAGVQGSRDRRADSVVLQNALAQSDADGYRSALADGSIYGNVDRSRLSDSVLTALANRTGQLQTQRANDQSFRGAEYNQNRTMSQNSAEDAAAPIYSQILAAEARGDTAGARKIASDNAPILSALSFQRQGEVSQNRQLTEGRGIGNDQSRFNLGQARETAADTKSANAALNQAVLNAVDPQSALQEYTRVSRDLGANAAAQFRQGIEGRFPGLFGPAGAGGGAAGGGGATTILTGGAQLPANIQTVGDIVSNKSALLGQNPRGTATGLYQITSDTWKEFGPKALGKDWESANIRDPQVQDKVAEAIWDSSKDSANKIGSRWASIPPSQAKNLVGKSWAEVRDIVSQGETSTNATQILRDSVPAGSNIAQELLESTQRRFTQDNVGNSSIAISQLEGDQTPASTVADQLVGEGGAMSGRSKGAALSLINNLSRDYGINPAQAARLIADNQSERSIPTRIFGGAVNLASGGLLGRPLSQSTDVDTRALRDAAAQIQSGGSLQQLVQNRGLTDNVADIQARQVAVQNAAAGLQLATQRLQIDPNNPTLQKLVQDRQQAFLRAQSDAGAQNVQSGTNGNVNALLKAQVARQGITADDVILIEAPPAPTRVQDTLPLPAGRSRGINY